MRLDSSMPDKLYDVAVLKKYGAIYRLVLHRSIQVSGFEKERKMTEKGTANNEKLDNSISRTRAKIFELAMCNPWAYFMTLTLNKTKHDRFDLKAYNKALSQWIRNYNKKHGTSIKYLLIPEKHKDGSWHMHGFITGIPEDHLKINEHGYLDWLAYREKFGYCSIDKIRSHEATSKYVMKYITKDLENTVKDQNAHMYYASKGLKKAETIKKGILTTANIPWDFQNDYVKVISTKDNKSLEKYISTTLL